MRSSAVSHDTSWLHEPADLGPLPADLLAAYNAAREMVHLATGFCNWLLRPRKSQFASADWKYLFRLWVNYLGVGEFAVCAWRRAFGSGGMAPTARSACTGPQPSARSKRRGASRCPRR